jgi:nitrite reductase/ring-hydroxylating ferredoxin subunit
MKPPSLSVLTTRPPLTAPKRGYLAVCPLSLLLGPDAPSFDPKRGWTAIRLELRTRGDEIELIERDAASTVADLGEDDELPEGTRKRSILVTGTRSGELLAFSNLCPHAGYPLHVSGNILDIEDSMFGIVPAVACQRHG